MATQIKLEIDTGNGNTALAANCGTLNPLYDPLFAICFGGQALADFHRKPAPDIARELDRAIDSLRLDRAAYQALTVVEQGYRPQVLDFCLNWRDKCREHPAAVVYLVP